MRPGLVAVGAVFAALAVGGLAALVEVPSPGGASTATTTIDRFASAGTGNSTVLGGPASMAGDLEVAWRSSLPLTVSIYASGGCLPGTDGCGDWALIANWTATPSGSWWLNGSLEFPYLIAWENAGATGGPLAVTTVVVTPAEVSYSMWSVVVLGLGIAALAVVGAILVFLGLYLRGGLYRPPAPSPPPASPPRPR